MLSLKDLETIYKNDKPKIIADTAYEFDADPLNQKKSENGSNERLYIIIR